MQRFASRSLVVRWAVGLASLGAAFGLVLWAASPNPAPSSRPSAGATDVVSTPAQPVRPLGDPTQADRRLPAKRLPEQGTAWAGRQQPAVGSPLPPAQTQSSSHAITAQIDYGKRYREILAKGEPFSDYDLFALRELAAACHRNQALIDFFHQERAGRGEGAPPLDAAQVAAQRRLRDACAEIPAATVAASGAEWLRQLHQRQSQEPAYRLRMIVPGLIATGHGVEAVNEIERYLDLQDPLIMQWLGNYFQEQFAALGLGAELQNNGFPIERLGLAWQLVACDVSGGCGTNSSLLLLDCLALSRLCDAASMDQSAQRLLSPDAYRGLQAWRQRIADSYRSGDWSWLPLDRLRQRYSR